MSRMRILLIMIAMCLMANLYAVCTDVDGASGSIQCRPGDQAHITGETGRYRQCMNVKKLDTAGNELSATHYICSGAWVNRNEADDSNFVCELEPRDLCW